MTQTTGRIDATEQHAQRGQHLRTVLAWGARVGVVAMSAWIGTGLRLPPGPAADLTVGALLGLALLGLGSLLWSLLRWIAIDWGRVLGSAALIATLGALALLLGFVRLPALTALLTWGVWLAAGVGAVALTAGLRRALRGPGAVTGAVAAIAVAALAAAALAWWWHPGTPDGAPLLHAGNAAPLALADPGTRGPLPVASLRYGGGAPAWRDAYRDASAIATTSVDLADLVDVGPVAGPLRRLALGFGLDAVPRNAIVWYPAEGDGPHPLVLVTHGNANLFVPSEDGYAWLGEHLASHGMVVASVDAAAFNALPLVGGLSGENDARALLLLAHLQLWEAWERAADARLPRVDLTRVALIGHSRGGEAAAIAASLDALGRLPADARAPLSERVGGPYAPRAVVAFAPSDGQFRVGDRPTELDGVDYLVLQGGYDADVASFVGERQYERTALRPDGLKAAVYLHQANHGQFNDTWGRRDHAPPLAALLRTAAIMPPDDQQRAARVFVSAFLRASLLGERAYLPLLADPRVAAHWLPAASYVTRAQLGDSATLLAPGVDASGGGTVLAEGLALWRVGDPGFRSGSVRDHTALTLGWDSGSTARWRLTLGAPLGTLAAEAGFSLGDATLVLEVGRAYGPAPASSGLLDATLVLEDDDGGRAGVALSTAQGVPPALPARLTRFAPLETARYARDAYPLYQRIDLATSGFGADGPAFDPADATTLELAFDRVDAGAITLRSIRLEAR